MEYEIILGFLIILLPLSYFFDRRFTHHDRRIKKKKIDVKKSNSEIIEITQRQ